MSAAFAQATAAPEIMTATPEAVANGLRVTFLFGAALLAGALVLTVGANGWSKRPRQ